MSLLESNLMLLDDFFPESVGACFTMRNGGMSSGPYISFNLARHVGDTAETVEKNRRSLLDHCALDSICWLEQIHKDSVVFAEPSEPQTADASWTNALGIACAIQVADCMPVLISDDQGEKVGAAHAGWRSLALGIIPKLLDAMKIEPSKAYAWLGPCIGQTAFEVGLEVKDAFACSRAFSEVDVESAFKSGKGDRLHADLQKLAYMQLRSLGCTKIAADTSCSYSDSERFFSFRRDGVTGRMAALIWIKPS